MNDPRLSLATKALLKAAKADAPGTAARAKIWSGVSGALGGAGAAGAAAASGGGAGAAGGGVLAGGAAKMLALGTLLGGTVTVGLAVALLHFGPSPSVVPSATTAPVAAAATATSLARDLAPPPAPAAADTQGQPQVTALAPLPPAATIGAGAVAPPPRARMTRGADRPPSPPLSAPIAPTSAPSPTSDDTLTHEASLVAEARGALVRGDPSSALRAVRAARLLPSHQLVPEEMALEAQALRALGRDDDAKDLDSTLKARYPESAFAR